MTIQLRLLVNLLPALLPLFFVLPGWQGMLAAGTLYSAAWPVVSGRLPATLLQGLILVCLLSALALGLLFLAPVQGLGLGLWALAVAWSWLGMLDCRDSLQAALQPGPDQEAKAAQRADQGQYRPAPATFTNAQHPL